MELEIEPWGGVVIRWPAYELWLLVEPGREAWLVWRGQPLLRQAIVTC